MSGMKMVRNTLFITLFVGVINAFSQLDLSFKAEKLDSAINSEYSECAPVFSPDGNKMYFLRINHPENRFGEKDSQDIWVSEKVDGKWNKAVRLPNEVNLMRYNALYAVLSSGELIISGVFDRKGNFYKRGLSIVTVNGENYGEPEEIKIKKYAKLSDGDIANVSFDQTNTKMFLSFSKKNGSKKNDLYLSTFKKNKWSKPKKLKSLNSNKSEESPFLSADGNTIYFSSNRENGKDNYDVYSSQIADVNEFRNWSEPEAVLGDISSSDYDGFFIIHPSLEYAYFSSNRGADKNTEIYRVKVKDVRDYVLVKGFVLNTETRMTIPKGSKYEIIIETSGTIGQPRKVEVKNMRKVEDSVFFEFELPFGYEYSMSAKVSDYESNPVSINLKEISSYQEILEDALVKPVPVLKLTGKVDFIDNTNANYDSLKIFVDGVVFEAATINKDGTYSLELPTGKKYAIEAKKSDFISFPVEVNVINERSRIEKSVNLSLEKIPDTYSFLNAKVTSKKDGAFLDPSIYQVLVNGKPASNEMMTKGKEGFELKLEMGKKYFIMVKSHDYIESHDSVDFRKAKKQEKINSTFELVPIEVGATVQIKNIYFDLGKATLKEESFVELDRLVELLNEHDHLKIEVSGHTDSKGNAYLNQKLSGDRALSVKSYLIQKGISEDRLESKGYGFSKPVSTNDTEENRAKNRRVEFTILSND